MSDAVFVGAVRKMPKAPCGAALGGGSSRPGAGPRGFEEKNLRRMMQVAEAFSDPQIVATLSRQLDWSRFKEILPLADPLKAWLTPTPLPPTITIGGAR